MDEIVESSNRIQESISDFNRPFTEYLQRLELPVEGVLAPIDQRIIIINSIETEIKKLKPQNKEYAIYMTRFVASVAAGLFDGAVTYLWNETIKCLRKMVVNYDLDYFYKVTTELNNRYYNLKTEDDLSSVADYDLIQTINRMGLITDHVFEVFKFINYMRNHSSAAHPSENEIGAFDLLSWLDNCIKYAINANPKEEAIQVKQLLYNIRKNQIPREDYNIIGRSIISLPIIMVEDFLSSIFGMYTDVNTNTQIIQNIEGIAKYAWDASSEEKRHSIGEKFGYYRKNGDIGRKDRAQRFLSIVDGLSYKDEDSISYEIKETLANLMTAHNSFDNFYNEAPWARQLKDIIPVNGVIPESIRKEWVRTIVVCYCGNGAGYREGVDENALPYYKDFLSSFGEKELIVLLNMMDDNVLLMDMNTQKASKRFRKLCEELSKKANNTLISDALDYLVTCNEGIENANKTTAFKNLLTKVNAIS